MHINISNKKHIETFFKKDVLVYLFSVNESVVSFCLIFAFQKSPFLRIQETAVVLISRWGFSQKEMIEDSLGSR